MNLAMTKNRSRNRFAAGLVAIVVLSFVVVGCSVAQLQAGLVIASQSTILAAEQKARTVDLPKPINDYPKFTVPIASDLSISMYARESNVAVANVFMVHGAGGGAWAWEYFFEALPEEYNLYALNWRGHFDSSPVDDARAADYVVDQEAVLTTITQRNELPVHILGHSYGGAAAVLQSAKTPHEIASLVLLAPVVPIDYTFAQRLIVPTVAPYFIRKDMKKGNDPEGTFGGMFLSKTRMQRYYDLYAGKEYSIEKPSLIAGDGVSANWQKELSRAYMAASDRGIPITIVLARYDNVVVGRRQRETAASIGAKLIEVESGHYIPLDAGAAHAVRLVADILNLAR